MNENTTSNVLLDISNLSVSYPLEVNTPANSEDGQGADFFALRDICLTVKAGQIVGVVGESGAGKSTIGKAVLGLLDPNARIRSGEISLNSEELLHCSESQFEKIRGRKIGYIYQNPMTALNPVLTIGEQVIEAIEANTSKVGEEARKYAIELLEQADVSLAEDRLSKYPHQLSGGLCQRIVFAIAIAANPALIIADEPTTALDVTVQKSVLQTLRKLSQQHQVAIILITHDMGVVAEMCNYVYVLRHGQHVEQGKTKALIHHPQQDYTKSLMASVPRMDERLHRFVLPEGPSMKDNTSVMSYLTQRKERDSFSHDSEVAVLQVKNLTKTFVTPATLFKKSQLFTAVSDVSFNVYKGETVGIVGESGSGKSTIGRMILGLHSLTQGEVQYRGIDLYSDLNNHAVKQLRLSMQCIFQDPYSSLNPRMTAGENITYGAQVQGLVPAREAKALAQDLMALVGLPSTDTNKMPNAFSGGERQRIGIARALAYRPEFIFCDEPTSALDVSVQADLLNLLKDLQEQLSLTLLFVSHDLAVIRQMCDRVIVMKDGKVVEAGDNEAIFTQPQAQYTQSLLEAMPRFDRVGSV